MNDEVIRFEVVKHKISEEILLPKRATTKSAGYDFLASGDVEIAPHEIKLVPTGIKVKMPYNLVLLLFDRSSNPKKRGIVLSNSVGVIDADYYGNDGNDGEIFAQFTNITEEIVVIKKGDSIMQGVFLPFFLTSDDDAKGERKGGFGSTDD